MEKLKFKYGTERTGSIESGDFVAINKGMAETDTETEASKFGSLYKGDKILGTTESDKLVVTSKIVVAGLSEKLGAGYSNGDEIPAGTSIQEILVKLLSKELYPSAAAKPSISLSGNSNSESTYLEIGSTYTLPAVSMNTNPGKFNASYSSPAQPATGVTFSEKNIEVAVNSGFKDANQTSGESILAGSAKISLGLNKITYSGSASYTAPTSQPKTNLGNDTTKTGESAAEGSATFKAGSATTSDVTARTGVYPVYSNISGGTLTSDATSKASLQKSVEFVFNNVPSEVVSGQHFMFDYPESKTVVSFKVKDLTGAFVDYAATYDTESTTVTKNINGTDYTYKRFVTTGALQGTGTYKITLNNTLDK